MATKETLKDWVLESLTRLGGEAHHIRVAEDVWRVHEADLRRSGDLFYTWQYDLRWAAQKLRDSGRLAPVQGGRQGDGVWRLPI